MSLPLVSQTRQNFIASASPRRMPVTAQEKHSSIKAEQTGAPGYGDLNMSGYIKAATSPRPANVAPRHSPQAILDETLLRINVHL